MKVSGRTRPRTPYTQEYIDRLGFVPGMEDIEERLTRLELAPRGIRREQSVIDVDIVAGGPQGPPGPPGSPFPHLIISPTHTDTSGVPFAGAVMTYNGATWTPAALPAASAGSAIFGSDYIIDAAYTGTAGATATTVNGHTVRLYATIDAALAHAVTAGGNKSFHIAGGTYNETAARTPPSGVSWAIHGVSSSVVKWTATANSQRLLDLGDLGGSSVEIEGVHFSLVSFTSTFGVASFNGILEVRECRFTTGNGGVGIWLEDDFTAVRVVDCDFDGGGWGISEHSGGAPYTNAVISDCTFRCAEGVRVSARDVTIASNMFNCTSKDMAPLGGATRLTITGNTFSKVVQIDSGTVDNLVATGNTFNVASGAKGLDFDGVTASDGFAITSNTFKGVGTAVGIALDSSMASGVVALNTFHGFTLANCITGSGGANLQVFHNDSDAGVLADQGTVVGHSSSSVSAHNLLDGGTAHSDTMLDGASRGSLIVGVSGSGGVPLWDELIAGSVGKVLRIGNALGDPAWLDLFSIAQYGFAPDAAPQTDVANGDQQGSIWHSGPVDETATLLYCDAETAAGTSVTVTIQYGDTNDLDTVASWTTIATKAMAGMSDSQSTMTNAAIPASRLIRFNVTSISGSAPRDMTVTLEVRRPIAAV